MQNRGKEWDLENENHGKLREAEGKGSKRVCGEVWSEGRKTNLSFYVIPTEYPPSGWVEFVHYLLKKSLVCVCKKTIEVYVVCTEKVLDCLKFCYSLHGPQATAGPWWPLVAESVALDVQPIIHKCENTPIIICH